MYGQVLAVVAVSFVLICLVTSFLRYERQREEKAPDREVASGTRPFFLQAIAHAISKTRKKGCFLVVVLRGDFPEPSDIVSLIALRLGDFLRREDQVHLFDGRIGLIFSSSGAANLSILRYLTERLEQALPDQIPAARESLHWGAAVYPQDGRCAEDLLAQAEKDGVAGAVPPVSGVVESFLSPDHTAGAAQKLFTQWRKDGLPVAVVQVQVDYLPRYAEQYGADAVAVVTQRVGEVLRANVREDELVGCLDAGTFMLLLRAGMEEAARVTQRISVVVRSVEMDFSGAVLKVTVSSGYSGSPSHGEQLGRLFEASSVALRQARTKGRGTCLAYEGQAEEAAKTDRSSAGEY